MTNQTAAPLTIEEELAMYRAKFGPLLGEKPKPATTHVLNVVDKSGSMLTLAEDVRGGFNGYVQDLQQQPGNYRLTACLFDTEVNALCTDAELAAVPELDAKNYAPRGMTALRDAVGKTITEFESRVTLAKADRVLVVIHTDGFENSSVEYDWDTIQKVIKDREATGQWSFVYLGAGVDTWTQARRMGVSHGNYVNTSHTSGGTRSTYSGLTVGTVSYAAGASGEEVAHTVAATPGAVDGDN